MGLKFRAAGKGQSGKAGTNGNSGKEPSWHWQEPMPGCCNAYVLVSWLSLSGFLSFGRCPVGYTGDRCQHFSMVNFSSMSLYTGVKIIQKKI